MIRVRPEPLRADTFAPFGEVVELRDDVRHFPINGGTTERYHDLARIDPGADGRSIVSLFRAQQRPLPLTIRMLERHPRGSQLFMPLDGHPYLVAVAPPGEAVAAADVRVFIAEGKQGVNYTPGVWHHPLLALGAVSDFLVIDRAGPGPNCDERELDRPLAILALENG